MSGANCWTDHCLVLTKLKLRFNPKRRPQGKKTTKRLNVNKLKNSSISQELKSKLEQQAEQIHFTSDIESSWASFQKTVYESSLKTLGTN
jgi:hypothetical protein